MNKEDFMRLRREGNREHGWAGGYVAEVDDDVHLGVEHIAGRWTGSSSILSFRHPSGVVLGDELVLGEARDRFAAQEATELCFAAEVSDVLRRSA
jgi:hypothetical protein